MLIHSGSYGNILIEGFWIQPGFMNLPQNILKLICWMKNRGSAANQSCHGNNVKVVHMQATTIHYSCHLVISDLRHLWMLGMLKISTLKKNEIPYWWCYRAELRNTFYHNRGTSFTASQEAYLIKVFIKWEFTG